MAKTQPIGVRFDEEKLALIKKEQNLKTPQKVVNYLMDLYGNEEKKVSPSNQEIKEKATVKNLKSEEKKALEETKKPYMSEAIRKKLGI